MATLQISKTPTAEKKKAAPRMFNLLEDESKERVLRFLTNFHTLSPLEQAVAGEELGVVFPKEEKDRVKGKRGIQGPALAVRMRDPSYMTLAVKAPPGAAQPAADAPPAAAAAVTATAADEKDEEMCAMLTSLVRKSLEGDEPAQEVEESSPSEGTVTPEQAQRNSRVPTASSEGEVENKEQVQVSEFQSSNPEQGGEVTDEETSLTVAEAPFVLYRSRGYQARRLACGDESPDVTVSYTPATVKNQTGMPIDGDDMREWFDHLDSEGRGELGVAPFLESIDALERNFGVGAQVEVEFRAEVEALAKDGLLTFEKFAYLVSRFARH